MRATAPALPAKKGPRPDGRTKAPKRNAADNLRYMGRKLATCATRLADSFAANQGCVVTAVRVVTDQIDLAIRSPTMTHNSRLSHRTDAPITPPAVPLLTELDSNLGSGYRSGLCLGRSCAQAQEAKRCQC